MRALPGPSPRDADAAQPHTCHGVGDCAGAPADGTLPGRPSPHLRGGPRGRLITIPTGASAPEQSTPSFADLGVPAPLVDVLACTGVTSPFPIQVAALPDALAGRDVLGRGRTGSGKTIAFALPLVTRISRSRSGRRPSAPRALVLAPTRELATQIDATVAPLAKALGLTTTTVFGGVGQGRQVSALRGGVDVLVACPGRLEDLIGQGLCDLSQVEVTVLDEADHMADLGFLPGVKRLLDRTPKGGQRLLFSATLDNGVDVLVKRYLSDPRTHSVDPPASAVSQMEHHVLQVAGADKAALVRQLAGGQRRVLLFLRTKHTAKKTAKQLSQAGVPAVDLHGNLSQGARERNLEAYRSGQVKVLVATDIAARGIHVDDVDLVVHVDPPTEHKAYLHRSGRTARAGAEGVVVTVATPDQTRDVRTLAKQAKISPRWVQVSPGDDAVRALVGEPAPHVEYVAPPAPVQGSGGGGGGGRRRRGGGAGAPAAAGGRGGRPGEGRSTPGSGRGRSGQGSGGGRGRGSGGGRTFTTSSGDRPGAADGGARASRAPAGSSGSRRQGAAAASRSFSGRRGGR